MRAVLATVFSIATPALADVPKVVTDIAPVRSIVSQIMAGAGEPAQIIATGASPHGYAMRPSEASALADADLVVWVGPALSSWLEAPLSNLAPEAEQIVLMNVPGVVQLGFREGALFASHAHPEDHAHEEDHEDHADHEDHDSHDDHSNHSEAHGAEDLHATDPHVWLDPRNVRVWASVIAARLATLDPDQAELYRSNEEALIAELTALEDEIGTMLEPVRGRPFLVLHDGFHYFEARFDIEARGSVYLGDGSSPGPARLQALRAAFAASPVVCAFAEPQMDTALLATATEGSAVRLATLDPLGTDGMSYADLMRGIATAMRTCLAQE